MDTRTETAVMDTLFDADAGLSPARLTRRSLVDAYAEQLLANPPVRSLADGQPNREAEARRLAQKDVDRVLRACAEHGWTLTLEKPDHQKGHGG